MRETKNRGVSSYLKLVSVLTSVERRADELDALLGLGLGHFSGKVADLPDEGAGVVERHLVHGCLETGDLVLLFRDDAADEAQVALGRLLHVLVEGEPVALESASSLLEGAGEQVGGAVVL